MAVNDNFVDALTVTIPTDGATYSAGPISNITATSEPNEPSTVSRARDASLWWKYTPLTSGNVTVYTGRSTAFGGNPDTQIAMYTGDPNFEIYDWGLTSVAADEDSGDDVGGGTYTSRFVAPVVGGQTYYIQVGRWASAIDVVLDVTGPASVVEEDPAAPAEATGSLSLSGTASGFSEVAALTGALTLSGTADASAALDVRTVVLNGTRQRRTAVYTLDLPEIRAVALSGTLRRRTGAFSLQSTALPLTTVLAGTRRRRTASINLTSIPLPDTPVDDDLFGNIKRWTFKDVSTGEVVRVPINPNEMSTPTRPSRQMQYAWGASTGRVMRAIDLVPDRPQEWSFSGVLLTKAHYDLLLSWTNRLTTVQITDHLDRTFETIIQKFDPVERLPTATREWRADYTMTCLLLRRVTA